MPWWPRKNSSNCGRVPGAAGHSPDVPGCGGRRGGWSWNQRCVRSVVAQETIARDKEDGSAEVSRSVPCQSHCNHNEKDHAFIPSHMPFPCRRVYFG
jgi:hypothetical protein